MFDGIKTLLNGAKTAADSRIARLRQWTTAQLAALRADSDKALKSTASTLTRKITTAQSTHQRTYAYTFDGNSTGRAAFKWNACQYYKVAEYPAGVLSVVDMSGTTVCRDGSVSDYREEANGVYRVSKTFVIKEAGTYKFPVTSTDVSPAFTAPEPGIYFMWDTTDLLRVVAAELNFVGTFKEVATVNGVEPDEVGNVSLNIPDLTAHDDSADAHADIRALIAALDSRVAALEASEEAGTE